MLPEMIKQYASVDRGILRSRPRQEKDFMFERRASRVKEPTRGEFVMEVVITFSEGDHCSF
jgi:hypothetical protein